MEYERPGGFDQSADLLEKLGKEARAVGNETTQVKWCPHCGQEIQDAAIKCRYCKTWLAPPPDSHSSQTIIRQSSTNGMAIASLVLGMLWMYWIGSILAICFGYAARREIRRNPDRMDGEGMALAGIILGWVGVGTLALTIAWVAYFYSVEPKKPSTRETKTTASLQLQPSLGCYPSSRHKAIC